MNAVASWFANTGRHIGWISVVLLAVGVVAYGFTSGDITTREASTLLSPQMQSAAAALSAIDSQAEASEPTSYSYFLHRIFGIIQLPVTANIVRFASVIGVLCMSLLIYFWLNKEAGAKAARIGALGFIFSVPALVMGSFGTTDSLFAFAVLATFCCIAEGTRGSANTAGIDFARLRRVGWVILACLLARFTEILANGIESPWRSLSISQSAISPFAVFLAALPTGFGCLAICRVDFWSGLAPKSRTCVVGGMLIGVTGLCLSTLLPGLWLGCALLSVAGMAVILGVCWQRWLEGQLGENSRRAHEIATIILMFGIPSAAIISGVARIGLVYNFMERVQAVVCVAMLLCVAAGLLIRFQKKAYYWVPAVCMAIALRVAFVHIYLPERDALDGTRPHAQAIARLLPPGETLYTQFPLDPTFRYYLGTKTDALAKLATIKGSELTDRTPWHALVTHQYLFKRNPNFRNNGWRIVRSFEGQSGQKMYLIREGFDSIANEQPDSQFDSRR